MKLLMIDAYLFKKLPNLLVNETVLTIIRAHYGLNWSLGITV